MVDSGNVEIKYSSRPMT